MSKTFRSACRNKHSEDFIGFVAATRGKDIAKQIKAIKSSKRYHKVYCNGDIEAQIGYENEIESLIGGSNFSYYEA